MQRGEPILLGLIILIVGGMSLIYTMNKAESSSYLSSEQVVSIIEDSLEKEDLIIKVNHRQIHSLSDIEINGTYLLQVGVDKATGKVSYSFRKPSNGSSNSMIRMSMMPKF